MLSGERVTPEALRHAEQLIKLAAEQLPLIGRHPGKISTHADALSQSRAAWTTNLSARIARGRLEYNRSSHHVAAIAYEHLTPRPSARVDEIVQAAIPI